MNVTEKCCICSGGDFAALAGYEHAYLAKCKTCGLVFSARTPTGEELQAHYSHKYSNKYAPDVWVSPITRLRLKELVSEFEPFRETGRILDVGCGQGLLLEEAKSQGWSCYGTEYSEDAIDFGRARGFVMHVGELKADSFEPNSFDVVALTEVVEHMSNPLEDLRTVSGFLRDGGFLYLTTPNFNSLSRRTLGASLLFHTFHNGNTGQRNRIFRETFGHNRSEYIATKEEFVRSVPPGDQRGRCGRADTQRLGVSYRGPFEENGEPCTYSFGRWRCD